MERSEILKQVNEIFINILDNEKIIISDTSTADEVEEWDSLNHIQIVVAVEKHFKIRFTSNEFKSWENVGEMIDSIEVKLKSA